mmetsp:Transcript_31048/g.68760  ORF Transcript_31048/g.68760 Transcript_31048/m.68760 type:complete len:289 (+) Transcript_31048:1135-2001(+)
MICSTSAVAQPPLPCRLPHQRVAAVAAAAVAVGPITIRALGVGRLQSGAVRDREIPMDQYWDGRLVLPMTRAVMMTVVVTVGGTRGLVVVLELLIVVLEVVSVRKPMRSSSSSSTTTIRTIVKRWDRSIPTGTLPLVVDRMLPDSTPSSAVVAAAAVLVVTSRETSYQGTSTATTKAVLLLSRKRRLRILHCLQRRCRKRPRLFHPSQGRTHQVFGPRQGLSHREASVRRHRLRLLHPRRHCLLKLPLRHPHQRQFQERQQQLLQLHHLSRLHRPTSHSRRQEHQVEA